MKNTKIIFPLFTILVIVTLGILFGFPRAVQADDDVSGLRHVVDMLSQRISALEEMLLSLDLTAIEMRISTLELLHQPIEITVNCPQDSVESVLEQVAERSGAATIIIVGTCQEEVVVNRDNITIRGASPGDGFLAPDSSSNNLILKGRDIRLEQLSLIGGSSGILASQATSFFASNLVISGNENGIHVSDNAYGNLQDTIIENSYIGALVTKGGALQMVGGKIDTMTAHGVEASFGGNAYLEGVTVRNCQLGAISAREGGSIEISNGLIELNASGVGAIATGHVTLRDNTRVQNNSGSGAGAMDGGSLWLKGETIISDNGGHGITGRSGGSITFHDAIIENNGSDGVSLGGGSTASLAGGTIVRNNIGHGIVLGATSAATFFDNSVEVSGNTGTAVICGSSGLNDVALIIGQPGLIYDNGSDAISCLFGFP